MSFYTPNISFEAIRSAVKNNPGNAIPISKTIHSDLITPILAYLKMSENTKYSFMLESVIGKDNIGRYTIIGSNPRKTMISGPGHELTGDPLIHLEAEMNETQYISVPGVPNDGVLGGAFGYIGYDCVQYFEPKTMCELKDSMNVPDSVFLMCDTIVVFDNLFKVLKIITHLRIPDNFDRQNDDAGLQELYNNSISTIDGVISVLNADSVPSIEQQKIVLGNEFVSLTGKERYMDMVVKMKEHIVKGDIFQSVPSQRVARPTSVHPFNIYRHLRTINPSPYMFYFNLDSFQIIGASPEMLAKVDKGILHFCPIAGTAKRGKDEEEDKIRAEELLNDKKERAEHVMLVDLGRNDLNRVCQPGTVNVDKIMQAEYYSHVIHITSNISGKLREDKTCFDAFRSTLPAGTLSGAPKVRAVQLIYEMEGEKRGVYGGAVGHFQYSGNMDTCIAIRTMVYKEGVAYLQAGAGIVYDSIPESEWEETLNKARSNVATIEKAENFYYSIQNSPK
ncbi:hypothetical protein BB559_002386 [Furculomyces boomerangus]|uniref:anthranilate synthase n=1 Tax=Furculomyces boomerangus TaxID=61424 RepID=A0A2T9YVT7_9FUNG|nr:hypothetical protein BB559_002386 [Furculomyces boomerangus]